MHKTHRYILWDIVRKQRANSQWVHIFLGCAAVNCCRQSVYQERGAISLTISVTILGEDSHYQCNVTGGIDNFC